MGLAVVCFMMSVLWHAFVQAVKRFAKLSRIRTYTASSTDSRAGQLARVLALHLLCQLLVVILLLEP